LERLLEKLSGQSVQELTRPFLERLGMHSFSFEQQDLPDIEYICGYHDQGQMVEGGRKLFPAMAAGAMGSAQGVAVFLRQLEGAWHQLENPKGISHETARLMLHGSDKGCMDFMGCLMGLGIFVAQAGENKFMLHQGANDGFRCIFLHCFAGPDRGKGVVALCNADLQGVLFNALVTQLILRVSNISGIDYQKFKSDFSAQSLRSEEVVNLGYKNLILDAFKPLQPEAIIKKGPLDPLAPHNLVVGARIQLVTNERFARAENLLSPHLPVFDPALFGEQGKIMDSWETVRHNPLGVDQLVIELKQAAAIKFILLSTKYHHGNHAPGIKLEGKVGDEWQEFLPQTHMEGHAEQRIRLDHPTPVYSQIRISIFPDGGFTRLGLYNELPKEQQSSFLPRDKAQSQVYQDEIPQTKKPLSIPYAPSETEIAQNLQVLKSGEEFNNASAALGAQVLAATNEHYSPARLVLSPFAPINMFDGMESARSRTPGHFDELIIKLALPRKIQRIEMDFTFFVNNNPKAVMVLGLTQGQWVELIPQTEVKPFAGNKKAFAIASEHIFEQIKFRSIPDGGMNRIRVISKV
jgi:allantoicase